MMQDTSLGSLSSKESSDSTRTQIKEITPQEAWNLINHEKAQLVDVRTEQELPDYGKPDLTEIGGESFLIPWRLAPDYHANPQFADQLKAQVNPELPVVFLCKVGGRSYEATQAAQAVGYSQAYNIKGGMDGEAGWKFSNLPVAGGQQ
jgi:rhodanese-related sulfurtransferase